MIAFLLVLLLIGLLYFGLLCLCCRDLAKDNAKLRTQNHELWMENSGLRTERDALKRYHDQVEAEFAELKGEEHGG